MTWIKTPVYVSQCGNNVERIRIAAKEKNAQPALTGNIEVSTR
jgi:hypothetical protein